MASGDITIDGYAGVSLGASMRGGTIHVKGDAGPRCGVAMKGGDIIVEGKIGYLSGFMAHAGRIIALGGADERPARTRCGAVRSGSQAPLLPWAWTQKPCSRRTMKFRKLKHCWQPVDLMIPREAGRRSYLPNASGTLKAGMQTHG